MSKIDPGLLARLPLSEIGQVTFYKRDEITTDLICCDVMGGGETWFFHEEVDGWKLLIRHLEALQAFQQDWFAQVSQPPFALSEIVAFRRS